MAKDFTEQIERSRKRLANCLNLLEAVTDDLEYVFEQNTDWTSDVRQARREQQDRRPDVL